MYLATITVPKYIFSYIVDNVWTHDKDLPAVRSEQGHYNNQVRIKAGEEGIMLIKNPREDNLIKAAENSKKSKKKAKAEVHESPKSNQAKSRETSPSAKSYKLQKCLSDDGTLVMSDADAMSMNDTLGNFGCRDLVK